MTDFTDPENPTDIEKITVIYNKMAEDDDAVINEMDNWELSFIRNQYNKHVMHDVELSTKESTKVDEIYEKLWKANLL